MNHSWTARAKWHGRRLAQNGDKLTSDLIGRLAWHEGADVTVQAMDDFSRTLSLAYAEENDRLGIFSPPGWTP